MAHQAEAPDSVIPNMGTPERGVSAALEQPTLVIVIIFTVRRRMVPEVQAFLRAMQDAGKPLAAICHAPRPGWTALVELLQVARGIQSRRPISKSVCSERGDPPLLLHVHGSWR